MRYRYRYRKTGVSQNRQRSACFSLDYVSGACLGVFFKGMFRVCFLKHVTDLGGMFRGMFCGYALGYVSGIGFSPVEPAFLRNTLWVGQKMNTHITQIGICV